MSSPPIPAVRVATLEAVNYTPVMLGNAAGLVVIPSPQGYLTTATPSRALIGKSRWLLRALIQDLGLADYGNAEYRPSILVRTRGGATLELGLVQFIYGTANPNPWRALYTVRARPARLRVDIDHYYPRNRSVTRYALATMGVTDNNIRRFRAPIRVGSLRLQVDILRRNLASSTQPPLTGDTIEELDLLVTGLAMLTLRILGIGQGANRGFGRFKIEEIDTDNSEIRRLYNVIRELDDPPDVYRAREAIREAIGILQESIQQISGMHGATGSFIDMDNIQVYRLDDDTVRCIERRIYRRLPGFRGQSMPQDPIHRSLEVIGLATLKAAWKNINNEGRAGGGAYHTWILGLPRKQRQNNTVNCLGSSGELPTGYLLESSEAEATIRLRQVSIDDTTVYTVPPRQARGNTGLRYFAEGRRQSTIILFPLDTRGRFVAILPFRPEGFDALVDRLYHAGGLEHTNDDGTPEFLDAVRLGGVVDIAVNGLNRVECDDNWCERCRENVYVNDRVGGVARPGVGTHVDQLPLLQEDENLVNSAYQASLAFIRRIFTLRCRPGRHQHRRAHGGSRRYGRPRRHRLHRNF